MTGRADGPHVRADGPQHEGREASARGYAAGRADGPQHTGREASARGKTAVRQVGSKRRDISLIELKHVGKVYQARDERHRALDDVSLTIEDGDIFGIIGASGAGKSTLVRHINLLERPTEGRIIIDDKDVTDYQGKELRELRKNIGMIFQNFSLFQQRTVLQNVTFPLEIRGHAKAENIERAHKLLQLVGLDEMWKRYPSELSGGQQQRVAIARALANNPRYMLCDEATSALDSRTTIQVLDLLKRVNRELGVTMVVITHSLDVAHQICKRIAVIDGGVIVEEGLTQDVFANPQSDVTRELLARGKAEPQSTLDMEKEA